MFAAVTPQGRIAQGRGHVHAAVVCAGLDVALGALRQSAAVPVPRSASVPVPLVLQFVHAVGLIVVREAREQSFVRAAACMVGLHGHGHL